MRTNRDHQLKESAYLRKGKGKGKTGKTGRTPLRLLSAVLSLSMLLTGCGPAAVMPLTVPEGVEQVESALQQDGGDSGAVGSTDTVITGFIDLPEDVREQTVPTGTTIEKLNLPDILEASIVIKTPENEGGG